MAKNLLLLERRLTKQDRDNIRFAVWQLRPDQRSLLGRYGIAGLGWLPFDDVLAVLREADVNGLLPDGAASKTIRNLQRLAVRYD